MVDRPETTEAIGNFDWRKARGPVVPRLQRVLDNIADDREDKRAEMPASYYAVLDAIHYLQTAHAQVKEAMGAIEDQDYDGAMIMLQRVEV